MRHENLYDAIDAYDDAHRQADMIATRLAEEQGHPFGLRLRELVADMLRQHGLIVEAALDARELAGSRPATLLQLVPPKEAD